MKEQNLTVEMDERDVSAASESLNSPAFKRRFVNTINNSPDPVWNTKSGKPVTEHVGYLAETFRKDLANVPLQHFHNGVFQKYDDSVLLTAYHHQLHKPVVPAARDLFHVYGPDVNNTREWLRYYRYAWKDKGPNGIIHSTDAQIIREGKLMCNSYAYSGQSSYALAGTGILFSPLFGDARISIRPYVQWLTSASFTGNDSVSANAVANLGIYVESWNQSGGGHYVDRDHWIPVWQQNTQSYVVNTNAAGSATVSDGLNVEVLAVTQRKYAIFIYAYLETSASMQQQKNETRFVSLDMDAGIPFVVIEETLM